MKYTNNRSNVIKTLCILGLSGFANFALAHSFSGNLNGKDAANVVVSTIPATTEVFQLTCDQGEAAANESTNPAAKMIVSIRDTSSGGSLVGVTLFKPDTVNGPNAPTDKKAQTTIDPVGGQLEQGYSPEISVAGGEGVYYATVFHTGNTPDNFAATFHCQDAAGAHSGTADPVRLSNQ